MVSEKKRLVAFVLCFFLGFHSHRKCFCGYSLALTKQLPEMHSLPGTITIVHHSVLEIDHNYVTLALNPQGPTLSPHRQ